MQNIISLPSLAWTGLSSPQTSYSTLKEAGAAHGILMGSEFSLNWFDDDTYAEIFKQEYAIGTAENACKWGATHQSQDSYYLDPCVNHLKRAKANGQKFRGHNLCWGEWNPSWLVNFKGTATELDKILKDHITYVM